MVKINNKQGNYTKGHFLPTMWYHNLKVLEDAGPFISGETVSCYVASYDNDRFAVWDTDFHHHNKYKVFSEDELHKTFEEIV